MKLSQISDQPLRPLGQWVLVRVEGRKESKGAIHLPDHTNLENVSENCGHVMATGSGTLTKKGAPHMCVEAGDRVLFRGFLKDANPIVDKGWQEDGVRYCLLSEEDILAVVGEDVEVGPYSEVKATA